MNVALFGRSVTDQMIPYLQEFIRRLEEINGSTCLFHPLFRNLNQRVVFGKEPILLNTTEEVREHADMVFSIGGDGTILDAVTLIGHSGIPIAGINMGRLGFLSGISKDEILPALDEIINGRYTLESRTLLQLAEPETLFDPFPYALNDLTIYKSDLQTMLTIRTYINGEFLNAYWADGLIVATPTGSTAYSLSCTGPIITPDSETFVITPIASHNLTVRPIVVRDDCEIRITADGLGGDFFIGMDSRKTRISTGIELLIRRADFRVKLVTLEGWHFFKTIREKLNWGRDVRN